MRTLLGSTLILALLSATTRAQDLVGETPDTSNWPHPAAPAGNPFPRSTASAAERAQRDRIAQLGKALFWEEQVSSDNTMACGTCHAPRHGGTDGRLGAVFTAPGNINNTNVGSFGVIPQAVSAFGSVDYGFVAAPLTTLNRLVTPVAAPSMIGAFLFAQLFWDRRAGPTFKNEAGAVIAGFESNAALEDLAVAPPLSSTEMGHESLAWSQGFIQHKLGTSYPLALVAPATIPPDVSWILALNATYDAVFDSVFASYGSVGGNVGVTRERFALAIAHYERTLIPDHAPIDTTGLTPAQENGFNLMRANGCFACHSSTGNPQLTDASPKRIVDPFDNLFSDGVIHTIGLTSKTKPPFLAQPARKTPTLRNLGLQQKFFSNGKVVSLTQLIDFYNGIGQRATDVIPQAGVIFSPALDAAQKADVLDFLVNALTDPRVRDELPPFDHPVLHSATVTFGANAFGTGTGASGTSAPAIIANAPPLVTKNNAPQWVKLGVQQAEPSSATAILFSLARGQGPTLWVGTPNFSALANPTNAQGIATYQTPFPLTTALIGIPLEFQWMVGGPAGNSFSNAAELIPFQF